MIGEGLELYAVPGLLTPMTGRLDTTAELEHANLLEEILDYYENDSQVYPQDQEG